MKRKEREEDDNALFDFNQTDDIESVLPSTRRPKLPRKGPKLAQDEELDEQLTQESLDQKHKILQDLLSLVRCKREYVPKKNTV